MKKNLEVKIFSVVLDYSIQYYLFIILFNILSFTILNVLS